MNAALESASQDIKNLQDSAALERKKFEESIQEKDASFESKVDVYEKNLRKKENENESLTEENQQLKVYHMNRIL